MKDEINDSIEKSFRVEFVRNGVLVVCRSGGLRRREGGGGGGGRAGGSKSFGRFHSVCRGVLVTLVVGAASVFQCDQNTSTNIVKSSE